MKEIIKAKPIDFEILSNGQTVWLNTYKNLARYNAAFGEISIDSMAFASVRNEEWSNWTRRVYDKFGVLIPDKFCPDWAK